MMRVQSLETDFLSAVRQGPSQLSTFNAEYAALCADLQTASDAGILTDDVRQAVQSSVTFILSSNILDCDTGLDDIIRDTVEHSADEALVHPPSPTASLPLLRYMLDNICYPYPDLEEKDSIVLDARRAGWHDFDKKKCEDWLNRKRHQSGFIAISRKYCDEDNDVMRTLCWTALYGSQAAKAHIDPTALQEIADMQQYLRSQYDEVLSQFQSSWVDELARDIREFCGYASPDRDDLDSDAASDDFDDVHSDVASDAESYAADFDDDSDEDDSDEDDSYSNSFLSSPVIGIKRTIADLESVTQQFPRRVLRVPSSSSLGSTSDSVLSNNSFRSFSGCSVSSATTVEWDDEDSEPHTKHSRRPSLDGAETVAQRELPVSPLHTVDIWKLRLSPGSPGHTKRKRVDDGVSHDVRASKRNRSTSLGITPSSHISNGSIADLAALCQVSWDVDVTADFCCALDVDSYTVDCTATYEPCSATDIGLTELAECLFEFIDPSDCLSWTSLQLHSLSETLNTPHSSPEHIGSQLVSSNLGTISTRDTDSRPIGVVNNTCHLPVKQICDNDITSGPPTLVERHCTSVQSGDGFLLESLAGQPLSHIMYNPLDSVLGKIFRGDFLVNFNPQRLLAEFISPPEPRLDELNVFSHSPVDFFRAR